ncbi:MAG: cupin domain-containing protein [Bacteroidia bacterium]|nr:cupin domain-containing protein [Bacteroidia bacterium]
MPILQLDQMEAREFLPGFRGKVIPMENTTVIHWEIQAGSVLPEHSHPHEQITQLLEGSFEMMLDGEWYTLQPGELP